MYKDVAKRVLAVILTFCMIGTMPDTALLASGVGTEDVSTKVNEADIGTAADDPEEGAVLEDSGILDFAEPETGTVTEEKNSPAPMTDEQQNVSETTAEAKAPAARDAGISLENAVISKPETIPNQIMGTIPSTGGFVTNEIVGLDIYNTETNVKLRQRLAEASTDGDYTVTAAMLSPSVARLTITGVGSYTGTLSRDVNIGKNIQDTSVSVTAVWDGNRDLVNGSPLEYDYEGRRIDPDVELTDSMMVGDSQTLTEGTHYRVIRPEDGNFNVGSGKVTIEGIGAYAGKREVNFTITAVPLSTLYDLQLKGGSEPRISYNKKEAGTTAGIVPALTVRNKKTDTVVYDSENEPLSLSTDFQFVYNNNKSYTNAEASVGLTAGSSGNCTGTVTPKAFWITRADVNGLEAAVEGDYTYTKNQIRPGIDAIKIEQDQVALDASDFEITGYGENLSKKGTVTIQGKGNYTGTRTLEFTIADFNLANIPDANIESSIVKRVKYTGSPIVQTGLGDSLTVDGNTFFKDTDYEIVYENNTGAGEAAVVFRAKAGSNCTGQKRIPFVIYKNLTDSGDTLSAAISDQIYTGQEMKPHPTIVDDPGTAWAKTLVEGVHYEIEYDSGDDYTQVTDHSLKIKGIGDYYEGEKTVTFAILQRSMNSIAVEFKMPGAERNVYTGSAIEPEVIVYGTNEDGTRTELPSGDFLFERKKVGETEVSPSVDAGEYRVEISPKASNGNYNYDGNPKTLFYSIVPKELKYDTRRYSIELGSYEFVYTGSAIDPGVTIRDLDRNQLLVKNDDYTYDIVNNTNVGTATVTISGNKNYRGTVTRTFNIIKKNIASATSVAITLDPDEEYVYTGETVVPVISKLVIDGREWDAYSVYDDFNIRSAAVNAGTGYTFTIEGKGNYTGSISSADHGGVTFDVARKDIGDALNVRVKEIANQEYTGSPVIPELVITYNGQTLVKDADYTMSCTNNTEKYPGTNPNAPVPTVTITGAGNYTGTREMTFQICDSIQGAVVTGLSNYQCTYTSLPCEPKPESVVLDGEPLLENRDYVLEYEDNIESNYRNDRPRTDYDGQPNVLIVGMGKYGGTKKIPFRINAVMLAGTNQQQLDSSKFVTSVGGNPVFTGSPVKPTLTVSYKTGVQDPETRKEILYQLETPKDFTVNPITDVDAGNRDYALQIGGSGNFYSRSWITIKQYRISPKPITSNSVEVRGIDGIDVNARPVNISGITLVDTERNDDGSYAAEGGTYVLKNSDYTMTATGLDRPGTAKIRIAGRGNYNNIRDVSIDIPGNLKDAEIEFTDSNNADKTIGEYLFTGFKVTPKIRVTCGVDERGNKIELKKTDYDYSVVGDAINHGTYQIVLTGQGAYEGSSKTADFQIQRRPLDDSAVKMSIAASVDYDDGKNVWPKPTLMLGKYQLRENIDYRLIPEPVCFEPTISSRKKYTLLIRPVEGGNFTGGLTHQYTIGAKLDVNILFVREADQQSTYTGHPITPELRVYDPAASDDPLIEGTDYELSYSDNINVGTVTITVAGLGDPDKTDRKQYYGTKSVTFQINPMNLGDKTKIEIAPIDPYTYTANPITPEPVVTWKGNAEDGSDELLEVGMDFQYRYTSNVDAGTNAGKVTISPATGNRNFTGSQEASFTINPKNLQDDDVVIEGVPDQVYIGRAIEPELNIHWGEDSFHEVTVPLANMTAARPTGYTATKYEGGNVDIGAVVMTIEGRGNYTGTREVPFNIVKVNLNDVRVEYSREEQYTGKQIKPPVSLKYDSTDGKIRDIEMTPEGWGYVVTYGSNERLGTRAGKITVTANPDGNCEGGPLDLAFDIVPRHITDEKTIEILFSGEKEPQPQYYNPSEGPCVLDIGITFVCDGYTYTLIEGEDYSVTYTDNDHFGTATVVIEGKKNFDDRVTKTFQIYKRLIDWLALDGVTDASLVYNGTKLKPTLNLRYINEVLTEGTDYKLVYGEDEDPDGCMNAGTHPGKIVGIGEYGGEIEFEYTIRPRDISNVTFSIEDQEYTGSEILPPVTGMDEGIDMPLLPEDFTIANAVSNKELGTALVTVAAAENSNYIGTKTAEFQIIPADITKEYMNISDIEEIWAYTGSAVEPEIILEDTRRNPDGTAVVSRTGEFYSLEEGSTKDYTITYSSEHIYPEEVVMTITGGNHYTGTIEKRFRITASLEDAVIDPIPAQPYTGEAVEPELTVRLGSKLLVRGTDYEIRYGNNINRSTEEEPATATIIPVENSLYTGSQTAIFMISRDIAGADIYFIDRDLSAEFGPNFPYTGDEIRPMPAVWFGGEPLEEGVDYEIEAYRDNIEVGTALAVIRGIGGYDGTVEAEFHIIPRSITHCDFRNIVETVYAGRATSQNLVVSDGSRRLQENRDYTVSYSDHAAPGIATMEISGIHNYGGLKTIRYLINVSDVKTVRAQGYADYVQLSWQAVPGAQGYAVYDLNDKLIARTTDLSYRQTDLNALTEYGFKVRAYIVVNGTTHYGGFSSAVRAVTSIATPVVGVKGGKKRARVSWRRIKGVSGYEIYRSNKKAKGYKKIRTAGRVSITSYTNKRLAGKTRYYYRVRAYKIVNGRKVYSSYSSPKSVKTK